MGKRVFCSWQSALEGKPSPTQRRKHKNNNHDQWAQSWASFSGKKGLVFVLVELNQGHLFSAKITQPFSYAHLVSGVGKKEKRDLP